MNLSYRRFITLRGVPDVLFIIVSKLYALHVTMVKNLTKFGTTFNYRSKTHQQHRRTYQQDHTVTQGQDFQCQQQRIEINCCLPIVPVKQASIFLLNQHQVTLILMYLVPNTNNQIQRMWPVQCIDNFRFQSNLCNL